MDLYQNPNPKGYQRQRSFSSAGQAGSSGGGGSGTPHEVDDIKKKKRLLHRDIERQRRQEMSTLIHQGYSSNPDPENTSSDSGKSEPASVMVQPHVSGLEVVVSSNSSGPEALPLSRVLEALQEKGLEVISSVTTRVNERLMHTIQVEKYLRRCIGLKFVRGLRFRFGLNKLKRVL